MVATIFTTAVVLVTHLPNESVPKQLQFGELDKIAHMAAYGLITLLFVLSLRTSVTLLSTLLLVFAILIVATFDELSQPFVNRTASLADWLANLIGVALVTFLLTCFKHSKHSVTKI